MLRLTVGTEVFNNETQEFFITEPLVLEFEHSLAALSLWESKWEKPFLGKEKTREEIISYIEFMWLNPEISPGGLPDLTSKDFSRIDDYINAKRSATFFNDLRPTPRTKTEIVTSELIYYWMTVFTIPFECETWHLNRLFTLIKICNLKADKPANMSRSDISKRNRELNAQRRAQLKTTG